MRIMKAAEVKQMTTAEIQEKIKEGSVALGKLKVTHSLSPIENPMQLRSMRKDIARLQTELRKRHIESIA
jgi:large subunit ribosomal protein L29